MNEKYKEMQIAAIGEQLIKLDERVSKLIGMLQHTNGEILEIQIAINKILERLENHSDVLDDIARNIPRNLK